MLRKFPSARRLKAHLRFFSGGLKELLHPPSSQIPFLDGLRSIAILLVVSGHLSAEFARRNGPNAYSRLPFVANGWIGVDLFFVLSGFFIGGQLWKEIKRSGGVSIGRFVLRRGFRIWPLYFFTFLCAFVFHGAVAAKGYGWSDLVFLTNYFNRGIVGGSWSLCTEEQFYILAPVALAVFAARMKSIESARPYLWTLLMLIPLLRAGIWIHETGAFFAHSSKLFAPIYYNFHTHCDGLVMGLIISNLWISRKAHSKNRRTAPILLGIGFILLLLCRELQHEVLDFTGLAFFFGTLVWFGLSWPLTLFNSRLFYWVSRLSFGMYLFHGYFCRFIVDSVLPRLPLSACPAALVDCLGVAMLTVFSAVLAAVTFCLVEHPFLSLRKALLNAPPNPKIADTPAKTVDQAEAALST